MLGDRARTGGERTADKTATHLTADDATRTAGRARLPGLVAVFSEHAPLPFPFAVVRRARIGRDAAADFTIDDPKASRLHVEVEPCANGLLVTDLKSHNGTYLCAARLADRPVEAPFGTTLRVGRVLLLVVDDIDSFHGYPPFPHEPLIGGPRIQEVRRQVEVLARSNVPLLVQGETGTGKERAAQAIHEASGRSGPLVAVNCAALPRELIESELFGHARGAFSGSVQPRKGLFRSADGGTLLLDEIGEVPLSVQTKLLRVIEDGMVRSVGLDNPVAVDVRIVAATNRDLSPMVESGEFRADLLFRFGAVRIRMPALRERPEDIALLVSYYRDRVPTGVSVEVMERLMSLPWPGNVRELLHLLQAASATSRSRGGSRVELEDLPVSPPTPSAAPNARPQADAPQVPSEVKKAEILTALRLRQGNVAQVARDLGMRRAGLYELFLRLGIDPSGYRGK